MMVKRLPAEQFLQKARAVPVIDVRSPAEFKRGHIPGAHNIHLFDDLERAEVGTLYHEAGREDAIGKGMEIAGPKMHAYIEEARRLVDKGGLLVYCWRGGMRSESMAWLFNQAGMSASILEGGYKGFRRHFRSSFDRPQPMVIIGGMTGSGKTELLTLLSRSGSQRIDLEELANHKGSVFGSLGLPEQPSNEHFENLVGMEWLELDAEKPVFLEDESINIGHDLIPKLLYDKMACSPLIYIDMPLEWRIERLYREYAGFPGDMLKEMLMKIRRRLGGANTAAAIRAIDEGRLRDSIRISLAYYDKAYSFQVKKRDKEKIFVVRARDENVENLLEEVLNTESKISTR